MVRYCLFAVILLACAPVAGCGAPPGVETAHQSYWYCWNRESLHVPDRPHPRSIDVTGRDAEHLCTDPELKDKGCKPIPSPAPSELRTEVILSGWRCAS